MKGKEALKIIDQRVKEGHTKKEIFDELTGKVKFRTDLLQMLAMVPDQKLKAKYQIFNTVLLVIFVIVTCIRVTQASYFVLNGSLILIPFLIFGIFIAGYFTLMIWNFRGNIYRILGLFGTASLLESVTKFEKWSTYSSIEWIMEIFLNFIPVILIILLSFYIGCKVFPYYGLWGMLQEKKLNI